MMYFAIMPTLGKRLVAHGFKDPMKARAACYYEGEFFPDLYLGQVSDLDIFKAQGWEVFDGDAYALDFMTPPL